MLANDFVEPPPPHHHPFFIHQTPILLTTPIRNQPQCDGNMEPKTNNNYCNYKPNLHENIPFTHEQKKNNHLKCPQKTKTKTKKLKTKNLKQNTIAAGIF